MEGKRRMTAAEFREFLNSGAPVAIKGASGFFHQAGAAKVRSSRPRGPKGENGCAKNPKKPTAGTDLKNTPSPAPLRRPISSRPYVRVPPIWFVLGALAAILARWLG